MRQSPPESPPVPEPASPPPQGRREGVLRFLASLGGIGYARFMSGTWGSLVAAPPLLALAFFFGPLWLLLAAGVLTFGGLLVVELLRRQEPKQQNELEPQETPEPQETREVKDKWDPAWIVIDEAAGVAVAFVPFAVSNSSLAVVVAFVLFRILDAAKPPPVRQAERLPGALGVMADDLVAGIGAAILTAALLFFLQALAA